MSYKWEHQNLTVEDRQPKGLDLVGFDNVSFEQKSPKRGETRGKTKKG